MTTEKATVTVESSDGKKNKVSRVYDKTIYDADDLIKILQGDDQDLKDKVVSGAVYGMDLKVRARIRQALVTEMEGPDTAVAKMAKSLAKQRENLGRPITPEKAIELAREMLGLNDEAAEEEAAS